MTHRSSRRRLALAVSTALLAALVGLVPGGRADATAPVPTTTPAPAAAPAPAVDHDVVVARPGTHTFRTRSAMVPVVTGPRNDLRFSLDTRLYVPDNASPRHPQPVILMTHGFGSSKDATEVLTTAAFFAAHGYVVLTYSSSGFGKSAGA